MMMHQHKWLHLNSLHFWVLIYVCSTPAMAQTVDLQKWTLNMNDGILSMEFNSGMDVSSMNMSALVIQQNQTHNYGDVTTDMKLRLTSNTTSSSADGPFIDLTLGPIDFYAIQAAYTLATSQSTSWLTLDAGFMIDLANEVSTAIEDGSAMQANTYNVDYTNPYLVSFNLNLNQRVGLGTQGTLTLTFNEVVDVSTLDTTKIVLRQHENYTTHGEGSSFTLTSASTSLSTNYSTIDITIGQVDLDALKVITSVAVTPLTTHLTMTSTTVKNMVGLPVVEIDKTAAKNVSGFVPDTLQPRLVYFQLDINVGILRLTFDEAVNNATLNINHITLQQQANSVAASGGGGSKFTFSAQSTSPSSSESQIIVVIGASDLLSIKGDTNLAFSRATTFISLPPTTVSDMASNVLTAVTATSARPVDKYIREGLISYDWNMNYAWDHGRLTLRFTGSILPNTADVTQITFQSQVLRGSSQTCSGVTGDCSHYTLTSNSSNTSSTTGNIMIINVWSTDLDQIKLRPNLAISSGSTFLEMKSSAVKDAFGDLDDVTPFLNGDILKPPAQVSTYTADKIQPFLQYYNVDMNEGHIILQFSEAMDVSSLNVSGLMLQGHRTQAVGVFHRLTSGTVSPSANGTRVQLILSKFDFNMLKVLRRLANQRALTYLVVDSSAMVDMAKNSVVQVPDGSAMLVNEYTADTTSPVLSGVSAGKRATLTNWQMDMDLGIITMAFSEPVDVTTLNVSAITLLGSSQANASSLTLSKIMSEKMMHQGGEPRSFNQTQSLTNTLSTVSDQKLYMATANVIRITLSFIDRNLIAVNTKLCVSLESTWMSITAGAIQDMAGVPVTPIEIVSPLQASVFTADKQRPQLVSFSLNMDLGHLWLYFSEAVNAETLNVTKLTLIARSNVEQPVRGSSGFNFTRYHEERYTLTNGSYTPTPDATQLRVDICFIDLNAIKRKPLLAKNSTDTFLTSASGTVVDMAGFGAVAILDGSVLHGAPMQVQTYTPDVTKPLVKEWRFDMRAGIIKITFTETVAWEILNVTGFRIQITRNVTNETIAVTQNRSSTGVGYHTDAVHVKSQLQHSLRSSSVSNPEYTSVYSPITHCHDLPFSTAQMFQFGAQAAAGDTQCVIFINGYRFLLHELGVNVLLHLRPTELESLRKLLQLTPVGDMTAPFLVVDSHTVKDHAGNLISAIDESNALPVHQSDCSSCPIGYYLARRCTRISDRLCKKCTTCPYDHYTIAACTPNMDTVCHRCTPCPYGKYISRACGGSDGGGQATNNPVFEGTDTQCTRCKQCGLNEFEIVPCEYGIQRQCQTCDDCSLSMAQERKCHKSSLTWRKINCCYDTDGAQVKPCKDVGLQEFKISARDSRRDEVWCHNFDRDKKQCMDVMGGNTNVPVPSYGVYDSNRKYGDVDYN